MSEIDPDRTVHYALKAPGGSGTKETFHLSENCPLAEHARKLDSESRGLLPDDWELCPDCAGENYQSSNQDWSYQEALRSA